MAFLPPLRLCNELVKSAKEADINPSWHLVKRNATGANSPHYNLCLVPCIEPSVSTEYHGRPPGEARPINSVNLSTVQILIAIIVLFRPQHSTLHYWACDLSYYIL